MNDDDYDWPHELGIAAIYMLALWLFIVVGSWLELTLIGKSSHIHEDDGCRYTRYTTDC